MKTASGGSYCAHCLNIVKNIDTNDNKNTTANRNQLHTRLQYNFYCLFNNIIKIHLQTI